MSELDRDFEIEEEQPGRRVNLFGVLTPLLLILTGLLVVCFAAVFVMPGILPAAFQPNDGSQTVQLLNTAAPAPSVTLSATVFNVVAEGVPPTWTPSVTPEPSGTPTPRGTATHTLTPSLTPTFHPTKTPTPTPTSTQTPTETPTPGPSPTPTSTRSAYPFTMEPAVYTANYANNAGCNWLGAAGQVFDLEGRPASSGSWMVWVTEGGVNYQTYVGTALAYGPAGWEVFLFDRPRVATHRIQLFSPSGTPVSAVYEFSTRASCNQNLVILNFVQNH